MTKLLINIQLFVLIMLLAGISCTEQVIEKKPTEDLTGLISFNGDYLEFESDEAFQNTLKYLSTADSETQKQWAKDIGFVSLKSLYENELTLQELLVQDLESKSGSSLSREDKEQIEAARIARAEKYSYVFDFNEDGFISGLKTFSYDVAALLNEDKIVKVAGHIFQYNEENIKIIEKGDPSKIELLGQVNETTPDLGIIVLPVIPENNSEGRLSYYIQKQVEKTIGLVQYKIVSSVDLKTYTFPIYGGLVCEGEGCSADPMARTQEVLPGDCHCYNEIIGYGTNSLYQSNMRIEKKFISGWSAYGGAAPKMTVYWMKDGQPQPMKEAYSTHLTIYQGAVINVTRGEHIYYADDLGILNSAIGCVISFID